MEQKVIDVTGTVLTPGDPAACKGNGEYKEYPCCCDECNYYTKCFPEWDLDNEAVWEERYSEE